MPMNRHFSLAVTGAVVAVVIVLPLLVFALARALNSGEIAPNVAAAGVHIGGLSEEDALLRLQEHERQLRETPAGFTVEDRSFSLEPRLVELDIDESAAVAAALEARGDGGFLDQFAAWVRSFRSTIEIPVDFSIDTDALEAVFTSWEATAIGFPAHEGGIEIVDGEIQPDYPQAGRGIDRPAATQLVETSLSTLDRAVVALPTADIVPRVTPADVDAAVLVARSLADGPITLRADDPAVEITFSTAELVAALRSRVVEASPPEIVIAFDPDALLPVLDRHRDEIERPAQNARFVILDNETVDLRPSRPATVLDAGLVADRLREVGTGPDSGEFPFAQGEEASFTTEEARAMGPIRRVSAFTTEYPAGETRVTNIHLIADTVDGAIVWPGESFSLNEYVGPRTTEKGYVPAPMILGGDIVDDIGGGVSQFATTFYNAVFFGCYEVVTHQPHSYYFSRYPEGREATISWPNPDLVFRNDSDALIIIDTSYTSTSVTVKFFGNNGGRDCESEKSDRYNFTDPETVYEPDPSVRPGDEVIDSNGWQGFTVDITRIMIMPDGSRREQTWNHRYLPGPVRIRVHPCQVPGSSIVCPIAVPSVIGLSFDAAAANLAEVGFQIEDGGTVDVTDPAQAGLVQSQNPGAGSLVAPGSVVTVLTGVYTEPPPDDDEGGTTTTVAP
jgi:vancomycin resistance protein YoaR